MPVDPATLTAFLIAATAVVTTPGPDTLLILRHAVGTGPRAGWAAVAGVQVGLAVHTLLAVTGLSFVVASSPVLFRAITLAGALYLGWLGVQGLRAGGRLALGPGGAPVGAWVAARQAFLTNLLNPKVILLFLALFPQFVDTRRDDLTAQLLVLAAVLVAVNLLWQAPLVWAGGSVARWLDRPGTQRAVTRVTGAVFLAFAVLMLAENLR